MPGLGRKTRRAPPRRWAVALGLAVLAAAAAEGRADLDPTKARPLPWTSRDGIVFFLDAVSFPADSGIGRTEFLLRIPFGQLAAADSARTMADGLITLVVKNARGKKVYEEKRPFHVELDPPAAGEIRFGHVVLLTAPLPPGWHEAELRIEDVHTQKVGLAYAGREVHESGKVKGILRVPDFTVDPVPMSELEAVWSVDTAGARLTAFRRGASEVLPNPSRTFGLGNPVATFYYEFSGSSPEDPLFATARVLGDSGVVLLEAQPSPLLVAGRSYSHARFDVSSLPAGGYGLVLSLESGGGPRVERRARFNVAWRGLTWMGDPHERVDEVHFLLDDADEEERFAGMSPGEQEAFLDSYWKERDPDPATDRNEERERFYDRVAYANLHFTLPGIEKGMFSDRGRIYIRYGPPDEIRRDPMPTHGLQVDDIAKEITREEGFEYAAPLKGRGIGADLRAFEIWTYDRLLSPSTEETRDVGPRAPLRRVFIFVDEEGYGSYLLRYSND